MSDEWFEERLRRALAQRADDAPASADGWARINERVAAGRRSALRRVMVPGLALGTAVAVVAGLVVTAGGDDGADIIAGPGATTAPTGGPGGATDVAVGTPFPGIWPEWTWEDHGVLVAAVRDGHQPWRADPVEVARDYVTARFGDFGDYEIGFFEESPAEAAGCGSVPFEIRNEPDVELGFVELCPVGDADPSPYVVIRSDNQRFSVERPVLEDPLLLTVSTGEPGTVTARVGAFASEWSDESKTTVHDGARKAGRLVDAEPTDPEGDPAATGFGMTLDIGTPPSDPLLVQVVHEADDGTVAFSEFRLDRARDDPARRQPHGHCDEVPPSDPAQADADVALRAWMEDSHLEENLVVHPFDGPTAMIPVGFTVVGDRARAGTEAQVCVATDWKKHLSRGIVGYTEDLVTVTQAAEGWRVTDVTRGELIENAAPNLYPVAFLAEEAECGESDDEFTVVELPLHGDGPVGLGQMLALLTGPPVGHDVESALPPHARVLDVAGGEDRPYTVNLSAASDDGGGACIQNARVEQIRRTFAAGPGMTEVVIQVDGETEGVFQP